MTTPEFDASKYWGASTSKVELHHDDNDDSETESLGGGLIAHDPLIFERGQQYTAVRQVLLDWPDAYPRSMYLVSTLSIVGAPVLSSLFITGRILAFTPHVTSSYRMMAIGFNAVSTLVASAMLTETVSGEKMMNLNMCEVCLMFRQSALNVFTGVVSPFLFGTIMVKAMADSAPVFGDTHRKAELRKIGTSDPVKVAKNMGVELLTAYKEWTMPVVRRQGVWLLPAMFVGTNLLVYMNLSARDEMLPKLYAHPELFAKQLTDAHSRELMTQNSSVATFAKYIAGLFSRQPVDRALEEGQAQAKYKKY